MTRTAAIVMLALVTACGGDRQAPPGPDSDDGNSDTERALALPQSSTRAEGFGAQSLGGRGGVVIAVTNLNDAGPGSLRACIEAEGPRHCFFRIAGTIELESPLYVSNPYLTIAGQTAPGGGITVKSPFAVVLGADLETGEGPAVHDIILQNVRFRRSTRPGVLPSDDNQDALTVLGGAHDILIDHCSFSWGTDETLSVVNRAHDVTIQWCIVSESFFKGSLISSGARNVTIHHTLYAHNPERNPKLMGRPESLDGHEAVFDFVNNVVYDWRVYATAVAGSGMANVVANHYQLGPGSAPVPDPGESSIDRSIWNAPETPVVVSWPKPREIVRMQDLPVNGRSVRAIYAARNVGPTCPQGCADDWDDGMVSDLEGRLGNKSRTDTPLAAPPVTATTAEQAFADVLDYAGASFGLDEHGRPFARRDAVDERIAAEVRDGTGAVLDGRAPLDASAWPALAAGTPYTDNDRDAMADAWERDHGLDPANPGDPFADADADGFTDLEEFFNITDPTAAD